MRLCDSTQSVLMLAKRCTRGSHALQGRKQQEAVGHSIVVACVVEREAGIVALFKRPSQRTLVRAKHRFEHVLKPCPVNRRLLAPGTTQIAVRNPSRDLCTAPKWSRCCPVPVSHCKLQYNTTPSAHVQKTINPTHHSCRIVRIYNHVPRPEFMDVQRKPRQLNILLI